MDKYSKISKLFVQIIGCIQETIAKPIYRKQFQELDEKIGYIELSSEKIESLICHIIIEKLEVYYPTYKSLIDTCAKSQYIFNYPQKKKIYYLINQGDVNELRSFLGELNVNADTINIVSKYRQFSDKQIIELLRNQISTDAKASEIVESIYSAFLYKLFPEEKIHLLNSGYSAKDFYQYLKEAYPQKYSRENALTLLYINDNLYTKYKTYDSFLSSICSFVKLQYSKLQNYCYLSIHIKPIYKDGIAIHWKLYSDIVLFAEKFIEEDLHIGYFHPDKIEKTTTEYIPEIDKKRANFNLSNTGFSYKDCFIIADRGINLTTPAPDKDYSILLLFQKNERDEDIIPCPTCRSNDVRGNSYPVIGVKSWECHNPICPDKSKYNRGKRYSLASIIKQEAIENPLNEIDSGSLSDWRLDVVKYKSDVEIAEYIVKQYSFFGDRVFVYNSDFNYLKLAGRSLVLMSYNIKPDIHILGFYKSCYFERFAKERKNSNLPPSKYVDLFHKPRHRVYNGNCEFVLSSFPDNYFSGAVTSPPYYNAREYSHWANIYCYLFDMYNNARQVYRTLKPGAYYLFNIFDYFDNENNVVFSDMGKKRMILGAYIIYLFQKAGFDLQQNIIWYKGHIQGHRNTNQGNNSPYYQAPLNCYEHVLCFRKPSDQIPSIKFPNIINVFPVVKIINGKNIIGHTAPFPIGIPNVLCSKLNTGDVVVDPYSGSFTTARCAEIHKLNSVSIELSKEYCNLGMKLLSDEIDKSQ